MWRTASVESYLFEITRHDGIPPKPRSDSVGQRTGRGSPWFTWTNSGRDRALASHWSVSPGPGGPKRGYIDDLRAHSHVAAEHLTVAEPSSRSLRRVPCAW